jgi:hypothetical protein
VSRNDGGDTCKRTSQPGTKAGINQRKRGGAATVKVALLSTRWSGFTEGRRGLSSPRWPQAERQALVKERLKDRLGNQRGGE